MKSESDADQLSFASVRGWVLVTHNIGHFRTLHRAGIAHTGILGLRSASIQRLALRIHLYASWVESAWQGRFYTWGQLQQWLESGHRVEGFSDADTRFALGQTGEGS